MRLESYLLRDGFRGLRRVGRRRFTNGGNPPIGKVVNIGTGMDISIQEMVTNILGLLGKKGEIAVEGRRIRPEKSEVMQLLSDTRLAQNLFQWAPRYTLEEGLRETIEWYREHLTRFRVGSYPL